MWTSAGMNNHKIIPVLLTHGSSFSDRHSVQNNKILLKSMGNCWHSNPILFKPLKAWLFGCITLTDFELKDYGTDLTQRRTLE